VIRMGMGRHFLVVMFWEEDEGDVYLYWVMYDEF
jgi:hypothetical protein